MTDTRDYESPPSSPEQWTAYIHATYSRYDGALVRCNPPGRPPNQEGAPTVVYSGMVDWMPGIQDTSDEDRESLVIIQVVLRDQSVHEFPAYFDDHGNVVGVTIVDPSDA